MGRTQKIKGLETEIGQLKEQKEEVQDAKAKLEAQISEVKKKAAMLDSCQQNMRIAATKCEHRVEDQAKRLNALVAKAQSQAAVSGRAYEMCKSELASSRSEDASLKAVAAKSEAVAAETAADEKSKIKAVKAKAEAEATAKVKAGDKKKTGK